MSGENQALLHKYLPFHLRSPTIKSFFCRNGGTPDMKCCDAIYENPVFCLPDDTVDKAARVMRREHIGSVPVVTDEQRRELIGVVSDRDLALKVVGESRDPNRTNVYDVMTSVVVACREDDDILSAIRAMEEHAIRRIPIV